VSIFAEFMGQLNLLPAHGATCRTYVQSFARISSVFTEEGAGSAGLCSARSPDSLSFLPLSFVKRKVYRNNPQTWDELKDAVSQEINITAPKLMSIYMHILRSAELRIAAGGIMFSKIFKMAANIL